MTFYYYRKENEDLVKQFIEVDTEKLQDLHKEYLNKYAESKDIKLLLNEPFFIDSTSEYKIVNYSLIKKNEQYEVSYTIYKNPKICEIIEGLLDQTTFCNAYDILVNNLLSVKRENIEVLRRKIDMEIRTLSILLDDPEYNCKAALARTQQYVAQLRNVCNFDVQFSKELEEVYAATKVLKSNISDNVSVHSKHKKKVKKISSF